MQPAFRTSLYLGVDTRTSEVVEVSPLWSSLQSAVESSMCRSCNLIHIYTFSCDRKTGQAKAGNSFSVFKFIRTTHFSINTEKVFGVMQEQLTATSSFSV